MGKKKKKRAQRKMAASLLPAVRSVEGGDGSAPCSPAKPNTSPGSAATLLAACCIGLFSYSCFTTTSTCLFATTAPFSKLPRCPNHAGHPEPWDEAVQELTMKSHSMPNRGEANFKYMVVHCYGDRHSLV